MKRDFESFSGSAEALPTPNATKSGDREAIAIIGFAMKFPQDVTSEENLWKLIMERRSTMTEVPKNRWNLDGFYKPEGNRPGTVRDQQVVLPYTDLKPRSILGAGISLQMTQPDLMHPSFPYSPLRQNVWIHSNGFSSKLVIMPWRMVRHIAFGPILLYKMQLRA